MYRFASALFSTLVPPKPAFHHHSDDEGRPYVCEQPHCTSPGFDPADEQ